MAFTEKKYLDQAGVESLWAKVKEKVNAEATRASGVEGTLADLTTTAKNNLVAAINEVNAEADANATAIATLNGSGAGSVAAAVAAEAALARAAEQANADAIDDVEDRLDVIEGEGEGSIAKAVSDGIASVVASAPTDFDTLKEVADWIANDTTGAAKMQSDIAILRGADTVAGSVAKAEKDAKAYADTLDSAMDERVDALELAVGAGGSVDSKISAAIADLDATKSQIAGADGLALSISEVDGKITAISGSIAVNTYDAYGEAEAAYAAIKSIDSTTLAGILV